MEYIEAVFSLQPVDPWREILTAELAETGFESFEHTPEGIKAWCPAGLFNAGAVEEVLSVYSCRCTMSWQHGPVAPVNWNEEWEKNYEPVVILDRCLIRAPFHTADKRYEFDIVIEPKMSFGTAHHETTRLMIGWLLSLDVSGKALLDMGCGTGVLAILAALNGASPVTAIDNYIWACENTTENAARNDVTIKTIHGDVSALAELPATFDMILANINRNVLEEDIPVYAGELKPQGELLISGFFTVDEKILDQVAQKHGLMKVAGATMGQWSSVRYKTHL
ncbi:MAG TPA: 50S ribosomal protein L11 methyltransferase [Bacteroidales bacterium]|nr:50S ribosomal protein L11 methyltransferase [Bacteroidales bacterium]